MIQKKILLCELFCVLCVFQIFISNARSLINGVAAENNFAAVGFIWIFMVRKKVLYLDGCVRGDRSQTRTLAEAYLDMLEKRIDADIEKIMLDTLPLACLDSEKLEWRNKCVETGDFSDAYFDHARKIADKHILIIAVPYWDLSFPAMLKLFCEQICINNLTFAYQNDGRILKMNKLEKVVYITTAGGYIGENNFGFEYIRGLFKNIFQVDDFEFYSAEGLDIVSTDAEKTLKETQSRFAL